MLWMISRVNERIGICDRFQQEMKYHRDANKDGG